jgi:hypothetical protein
MKVNLTSRQGVVEEIDGNSVLIEGKDYREAPFDERWDDLGAYNEIFIGDAGVTELFQTYRDTDILLRYFMSDRDHKMVMTYQMPHSWDPSTSIKPHLHYIPMAAGNGSVKLNYAYAWANNGYEFPGNVGWTSGSITFVVSQSMQYTSHIASIATLVPPAAAHESSILMMKVQRVGSDPQDTYKALNDDGSTGNISILYFDVHYQKIKAGTVKEF